MAKQNKVVNVLSKASLAGMVASAMLTSQAFAAVDAYTVKVGDDVFKYDKAELVASFLDNSEGLDAPLYEDFTAKVSEGKGVYAFHDDKNGYVDFASVSNAFLNAEEGTFNLNSFTESEEAEVVTVPTVKKVTVVDGAIKEETEGEVVTGDLKVESVSAINAKQVKVVFNREVDKSSAETVANYTIKKNGSTYTAANALKAELQADKKTVIISDISSATKVYANYASILASGNSYQVIAENVMDTNYKAMIKYESDVKAFLDSEAPKLTKSVYEGGVVKLYFNEPVNPATVDYKVDGGSLYSNGTGITSRIDKEEYILEFTAATSEKTVGNHTVTLYEVDDALTNREAVASATYSVSSDTTAPYVTSITPDGMYSFKVKFSEALSAEPTVTAKKGALTLSLDTTYGGGNGIALDSSDSSNTTYIVKVTDVDTNNKVYLTGETSVALSVNVKGYSDASNVAGAEFNGSVTLSKDSTAPSVVNVGLNKGVVVGGANNDQLNVTFNEDLDNTYSTDGVNDAKITVKKDGIVLSTVSTSRVINDADGNPRVVEINLGADLTPGTYTVELAADAIADKAGNKNAAVVTTANYTDSSVFLASTITTPATNVFQVVYTTTPEMTDSAITLSNYTLDGAALPAGTTIGFYSDKKTVRITLPSGSVANTSTGLLRISKNVVNKDGVKVVASVNPDVEKTGSVAMTDNVNPTISEVKYLVNDSTDTTTTKIKVKFSENLASVTNNTNSQNDFKVLVNGVKQTVSVVTDGTANDKEVVLTLANSVNVNQVANVTIVAEADQDDATASNNVISVTDVASNKATGNSTANTTGTELDASAIAANAAAVANDKNALTATSLTYGAGESSTTVKTNVTLPTLGSNGSTITWSEAADAASVATVSGSTVTIARSNADDNNDTVTLRATITKGTSIDTKDITITVLESLAPSAPTAGLSTNTIVLTGDAGTTIKYAIGATATDANTVASSGTTYSSAIADTAVSNGQHVSIVSIDAAGNVSYADYVVAETTPGTIDSVTVQ